MGIVQGIRSAYRAAAYTRSLEDGEHTLDPITIAPRRGWSSRTVSARTAMTLSTVYRGISIHATAASQLGLRVERNDVTIATPALVRRPCLGMSRSAFIEFTVVSLYTDGNAFWRLTRALTPGGEVVDLEPLNPHEVFIEEVAPSAFTRGGIYYHYRGEKLTEAEVHHLKLLRISADKSSRGLGPIQAAQLEVAGALDARDYGALWLSEGNIPDGILTTDQPLGPTDGEKYRNVWYGRNPDGSEKVDPATGKKRRRNTRERLRVLGAGLKYAPLLLKPSEVQFLESQQFTTTQLARLLGLPASLLLAAVQGNSQTYANVEQDWIAYVRFGLMKALREVEEGLTELLPGKQTVRFELETLYRTDTKTRYEGHESALRAGWLTRDEVRAIEGRPPLSDAQRAELDAAPAPSTIPAQEAAK